MIDRIRYLLRLSDLTEQEIRLYLQILKKRTATIPALIASTKIPPVTVYRAMRKLEERGMVQPKTVEGRQREYSPLSLEHLARHIGGEQRKLRRLELALKNLDRLLPFMGIDELEPDTIEIREGVDAFRDEYVKIPDTFENEFLAIGTAPNFWKTAQMNYECPEERNFIARRLSRNIYSRVLNMYEPQALLFQRNDSREKRTTMLTDELPIKKDCLMMCSRQVSHFVCDVENPRVIIIRQPELVALHEQHFQALWKRHA
ncbi:MAG: hypothetical protein HOO67_06485 [Candidatus Peribacteraceae bacterium]|nr:hypothetical protein [Candidatus Peribacteraceae bacterium]